MLPKVDRPKDQKFQYSVNYDFPSADLISTSKINGHNVSIKPVRSIKISGSNFDFTPGLEVKFGKIDIKEMFKFYDTMITFFQYVFMRKDILPDKTTIICEDHCGTLYSPSLSPREYEPENLNKPYIHDFLPWGLIYQKAGNILELINSNDIYISHLPDTVSNRYYTNQFSFLKVTPAFEADFEKATPALKILMILQANTFRCGLR